MYRKKNEKQQVRQANTFFSIQLNLALTRTIPCSKKKYKFFCTGDVQALLVKKFRKWKVIIYLKNTISKELLLQY